jgi:hypothetical protein
VPEDEATIHIPVHIHVDHASGFFLKLDREVENHSERPKITLKGWKNEK